MKSFQIKPMLLALTLTSTYAFAGQSRTAANCTNDKGDTLTIYEARPFPSDSKTWFLGITMNSKDYFFHTSGGYEYEGVSEQATAFALKFNESGSSLTRNDSIEVSLEKPLFEGKAAQVQVNGTLIRWTQEGLDKTTYSGQLDCTPTADVGVILNH